MSRITSDVGTLSDMFSFTLAELLTATINVGLWHRYHFLFDAEAHGFYVVDLPGARDTCT